VGAAGAVTRGGRLLRGLSGLLAGGLVVLVVVLCVGWVIAVRTGTTGPSASVVVWHVVAAAAAVVGQVYADRHHDVGGAAAAFGVIGVASALVALQWLA
jgi:hypothetical protein